VEYLLEVHDKLGTRLAELGRTDWVSAACDELRRRPVSGASPDDAWLRLKDARTLRPKARGVARSVAAWRERKAMRLDVPVRQVLPDLAILGIAQRAPDTARELAQARGVDERHVRGATAEELLVAVREGCSAAPPEAPASSEDLERHLRPAVTLISAWMSQLARDESIDTALLATRSDLVAFLRGDADARLASGWRSEMVGDGIRALVAGEAALTFDGQGRLRLIPVSA
jgi:ribonuclease D